MNKDYKVGNLIYDANLYDALNQDTTDLKFYKDFLSSQKIEQVLEMCCGTGRLTVPLAREGFQMTGVDNSQSMLKSAEEKAKSANMNIQWILADILNLDLRRQFHSVLIPFNSIHHIYSNKELIQLFRVVKNHLAPNSYFLFDCYNPNLDYIVEGEKQVKSIAKYSTKDRRKVEIIESMKYERDSQINRIKWQYIINDIVQPIQNMDMRLYFPQELDFYLSTAGFEIIEKYGDFSLNPFIHTSEKQIYICRVL